MNEQGNQPLTLMKIREKSGLTQRQLADLLGVTVSTVSNWERGVQTPRLTFAQTKQFLDASGLTIEDLVSAFEGTRMLRTKNAEN